MKNDLFLSLAGPELDLVQDVSYLLVIDEEAVTPAGRLALQSNDAGVLIQLVSNQEIPGSVYDMSGAIDCIKLVKEASEGKEISQEDFLSAYNKASSAEQLLRK